MIERIPARRLDQKLRLEIGRILKSGRPTTIRSHQLVKTLKAETPEAKDWHRLVVEYFDIPFSRRKPQVFQKHFGVAPYPWLLDQFLLKLHQIQVSETDIQKAAANFFKMAHELLPAPKGILVPGIAQAVIHKLVNPRYDRSFFTPNLIDFTEVWADIILKKFGSLYEGYFSALLQALHQHSLRIKIDLLESDESPMMGEDPTETELQWLLLVVKSLVRSREVPGFPLQGGPKHRMVQKIHNFLRQQEAVHVREVLTESIILLHRYKKVHLATEQKEAG